MQVAAKNFRDYFVMNDLGASSMQGDRGRLYRTVNSIQEHIGRISYNGRLWDVLGNAIQLPSADEAKAEQIEAVAIRHNPIPDPRGPPGAEHRVAFSQGIQLGVLRACLSRSANGDRVGGRP
jgi:hypothetical protein